MSGENVLMRSGKLAIICIMYLKCIEEVRRQFGDFFFPISVSRNPVRKKKRFLCNEIGTHFVVIRDFESVTERAWQVTELIWALAPNVF